MNVRLLLPMMACLVVISQGLILPIPVFAKSAAPKKQWTVTDRQDELKKRVDKDEKSYELTQKEAGKLRSRLQDITDREQKAKDKNGGKLSYKDEGKAEKNLNSVSLDIDKHQLAKRVQQK
jgi:competence protein ComGC